MQQFVVMSSDQNIGILKHENFSINDIIVTVFYLFCRIQMGLIRNILYCVSSGWPQLPELISSYVLYVWRAQAAGRSWLCNGAMRIIDNAQYNRPLPHVLTSAAIK